MDLSLLVIEKKNKGKKSSLERSIQNESWLMVNFNEIFSNYRNNFYSYEYKSPTKVSSAKKNPKFVFYLFIEQK